MLALVGGEWSGCVWRSSADTRILRNGEEEVGVVGEDAHAHIFLHTALARAHTLSYAFFGTKFVNPLHFHSYWKFPLSSPGQYYWTQQFSPSVRILYL